MPIDGWLAPRGIAESNAGDLLVEDFLLVEEFLLLEEFLLVEEFLLLEEFLLVKETRRISSMI